MHLLHVGLLLVYLDVIELAHANGALVDLRPLGAVVLRFYGDVELHRSHLPPLG